MNVLLSALGCAKWGAREPMGWWMMLSLHCVPGNHTRTISSDLASCHVLQVGHPIVKKGVTGPDEELNWYLAADRHVPIETIERVSQRGFGRRYLNRRWTLLLRISSALALTVDLPAY